MPPQHAPHAVRCSTAQSPHSELPSAHQCPLLPAFILPPRSCASDCMCPPLSLDAHHAVRESTTHLATLQVQMPRGAECRLRVTVLPNTTSKEHKFKVGCGATPKVPVSGRTQGRASPLKGCIASFLAFFAGRRPYRCHDSLLLALAAR